MPATLEIELIVGACSFDVVASNPAGNSDPTRVTIDGELIMKELANILRMILQIVMVLQKNQH